MPHVMIEVVIQVPAKMLELQEDVAWEPHSTCRPPAMGLGWGFAHEVIHQELELKGEKFPHVGYQGAMPHKTQHSGQLSGGSSSVWPSIGIAGVALSKTMSGLHILDKSIELLVFFNWPYDQHPPGVNNVAQECAHVCAQGYPLARIDAGGPVGITLWVAKQ